MLVPSGSVQTGLPSWRTRLWLALAVVVANFIAFVPIFPLLFVTVMMVFTTHESSPIAANLIGLAAVAVLSLPTFLVVAIFRRLREDSARISSFAVAGMTVGLMICAAVWTDRTPMPGNIPLAAHVLFRLVESLGAFFKDGDQAGIFAMALCGFVGAYAGTYWPSPAGKYQKPKCPHRANHPTP